MFKRLFVCAFLALATLSIGMPAHASTLTIDYIICTPEGGGRAECQASASGGTGGYTYNWGPYGYGDYVIVSCSGGQYDTVSVFVTDSSGATVNGTTKFYCA